MKNKIQQTQTTTSGTTATTTSSLKITLKQYTSTPKMTTISSPQTSVMKPVRTSVSQNRSWKSKGKNVTTTSNTTASSSVPTNSKNDKYISPFMRSKVKDALIQLLETIPKNLLSESETEGEDNDVSDVGEMEMDEEYIHISHSDVEEQ